MRICSFLPSATEIIYTLGLGEQLYGVTRSCDYPAEALTKPIVVRSILDEEGLTSGDIEADVFQRRHLGAIAAVGHRQVADRSQNGHDRPLLTAVVSTIPSPAR